MISLYTALALLVVYGIILFAIAFFGESVGKRRLSFNSQAMIYSLSLAVFCTSWTYYGNLGQASNQGINHLAIYLGASIGFIFFIPILKMMVRIKNAYHTTSIADFISTRYHNSQALAALISIICLVGIVPYISIQLKSIITAFELLVDKSGLEESLLLSNIDIIVVLMMAVFTIVFGVRHLDPTERHPGMMVALAAESVFKLFTFLFASVFICYFMFDGVKDIVEEMELTQDFNENLDVYVQIPSLSAWFTPMILGMIGILALPRQFHVGIVECSDEKLLDSARWQFPLYLLLTNILIFPVAMAAHLLVPSGDNVDLLILNIPVTYGHGMVAALVFLGGFAAATGMIMISSMTLSTMATNHLIVPIIESKSTFYFLRQYLLYIRWLVVGCLLFVGLYYYMAIGESALIVSIASISSVAFAQLIPPLIGGLFWSKGNLSGAMAGLLGGTAIWTYSAMLPSFIRSGTIESNLLEEGLFQLAWLKPEQLFGLEISSPIGHSLFWSLLVNTVLYIVVSEWRKVENQEHMEKTQEFLQTAQGDKKSYKISQQNLESSIDLKSKFNQLSGLLSAYLPANKAQQKLEDCFKDCDLDKRKTINIVELAELRTRVSSLFAGIIGMAAADRLMRKSKIVNESEQKALSEYYSNLLSNLNLSPHALMEKVDFYKEKQALLKNHAEQQNTIIEKLKIEQQQTLEAERALKELNDQLEQRVEERTQQLSQANSELIDAMENLQNTQKHLVEAEKMASLGGLVAGVAHEINTPIGIVLTAISSLKEQLDHIETLLDEETLEQEDLENFCELSNQICQLSMENISKAADLISSFKQVAADQSCEEERVFVLYDYIQDILLSLDGELNKYQHKIQVDCDKKLKVHTYPGALSQIFSNLILNTLTHAYEPGDLGLIQIHAVLFGEQLTIKYQDNGKGLSNEAKEKIFEPFYTTNRGIGGNTGLGAHIVYNTIKQQLKGDIHIDDRQSQGLGFVITIPLLSIIEIETQTQESSKSTESTEEPA